MNFQSWCGVLESTFLKYDWSSEHAKQHTYFDRKETNPEIIENIVRSYYSTYTGGCIKERDSNRGPNVKCILFLNPYIQRLTTVIVDRRNPRWKIITYYYTEDEQEIRRKFGYYGNFIY